MHILVIIGSTRQNRNGERVKQWLMQQLSVRDDATYEIVDLRDVDLPFYDEVDSINTLEGNFSHEAGKTWNETIKRADGFIIATCEYNHGIPGVLKNAIDYGWGGWNYKPMSIISYSTGQIGGARAAEQLRLVSQGVLMLPLPTAMHISQLTDKIDANGQATDDKTNSLLDGLCQELTDIASKLKT